MRRLLLALAGLCAAALPPPALADMYPDASNAVLPAASEHLGTSASISAFGAACDGVTDDAAAFAAASLWLAGAAQRTVSLPARVCNTSQSVTIGDGRQQSTTLTSAAAGSALAVASCAGIQPGDAIAVRRDDGSRFEYITAVSCAGTTLTLSAPYTGAAASSGNVVFTGRISSYGGGGYKGQGGCLPNGTVTPGQVSGIRYIGAASPTTSLGANAAAGAGSLTVASIAGIALGDAIGVLLNDASIYMTWVSETPAGSTVKLGNDLPTAAASGNEVRLEGNPVVRVNGPAYAPVLEGVCLDGNYTQFVGLDWRHGTEGRALATAIKYTGVGVYLHPSEFYVGAVTGLTDNRFELHTALPASGKTVGCWARGTPAQNVAFSRNRFDGGGCTAGGNDLRAAGLLLEFADNNVWYKPYTPRAGNGFTAGAGLYRQPSRNLALFPGGNAYFGGVFLGGVADGTATGGSLGMEYMPAYGIGDGAPIPTSPTISGSILENGLPFGKAVPYGYAAGAALSLYSGAQVLIAEGAVADGTNQIMLRVRTGGCAPGLNVSGDRGLDSASARLANTWYGVFVTGFYADGTTSCMFAQTTAGAVAPALVLPGAFRFAGYVGKFRTDGSSNVDATTITSARLGAVPALTACGTGPSIVGGDRAATVTLGTGAPAGCVITFAAPYATAPPCSVSWRGTPLAVQSYAVSAAAITLTQTATSSNKVDYVCQAQGG